MTEETLSIDVQDTQTQQQKTMTEEPLPLELDLKEDTIIKVMGIGGGGCNAVNYMYQKGIKDVSFLVCNTDRAALGKSSVPAKLQLGTGLGAGGEPTKAQQYAEESRDRIREALDDGTKMLFITAGMGGGTGTGASAVVAEIAQEMGILTVGIVTIPFAFEGAIKIRKAMTGVARLAKHVDALLIINNEKLKQIYPNLEFIEAFAKSDDVVCNAAKSIAEIITIPGYINTDFADVYNTLKNGNMAIMNVGEASGENRITEAINDALNSPLINTNDVHGAKRVLMQFYFSNSQAIKMNEIDQIKHFIEEVGDEVEVQWGATIDESLGETVRVTIIATGYDVTSIPMLDDDENDVMQVEGESKKKEGKTIEQAIVENYPEQMKGPKEDEKPQELDLTGAIQEIQTKPQQEEVLPHREDDINSDYDISFDDSDEQPDVRPAEPIVQQTLKPDQHESLLKKWMRNRRSN